MCPPGPRLHQGQLRLHQRLHQREVVPAQICMPDGVMRVTCAGHAVHVIACRRDWCNAWCNARGRRAGHVVQPRSPLGGPDSMAATPAVVLAVVRAHRPVFRSAPVGFGFACARLPASRATAPCRARTTSACCRTSRHSPTHACTCPRPSSVGPASMSMPGWPSTIAEPTPPAGTAAPGDQGPQAVAVVLVACTAAAGLATPPPRLLRAPAGPPAAAAGA